MKSSEIFALIHRCLIKDTPEIICLADEQRQKKNCQRHLHKEFEVRMHFCDDGTAIRLIEVIPPQICHQALLSGKTSLVHVLRISDTQAFCQHGRTQVPQHLSSPYSMSLVYGLASLAKQNDSAVRKEECRLLLSLFYLTASVADDSADINNRLPVFAEMLHANFHLPDLSIADMAQRVGISPRYIQQIFRERYSLNPKEYLLTIRMENAKKLLSEKRYYIHEIASLCGFTDAHYFSEVFRRYFGLTPREYLKKNKQQEI